MSKVKELAKKVEAAASEDAKTARAKLSKKTAEQVDKALESSKGRRKTSEQAKPTLSAVDAMLAKLREGNDKFLIGRGTQEYVDKVLRWDKFPSGIPQLDHLIGGGIPSGRFTVFWGPKASCKTAAALMIIAHYQASHPEEYVMLLDAEQSFDPEWAAKFGVDFSKIIFIPGTMALEDMMTEGVRALRVMREGGVVIRMILVDSVGAMSPVIETEGKKEKGQRESEIDLRQDHVGTIARKVAQFLRAWNPTIRLFDTSTLVIAHATVDIQNGGREIMSGGKKLEHFAHIILRMYRRNDDFFKKEIMTPDGEKKEVRAGFFCVIQVEKTKVSNFEGHSVAIPFLHGVGFETTMALFNSAVGYGIIDKAGAWYKYKGENIGQGKEAAMKWLDADRLRALEIKQSLITYMQMQDQKNKKEQPTEPAVQVEQPQL